MCFWCEMKKFLLLSARDDGVFTVETVGLAGGGGGVGAYFPALSRGNGRLGDPDFPT